MPIIKSAKKRVKVAAKQSIQNNKTKKSLKSAVKLFQAALTSGKKVDETQKKAQSTIDTAVKKGVISKSRAARLNSRLNSQAKKANKGKKKASVKKTPVKKTTPVKTKKATTKKAAPKKAAAKKKPTKK